MNKSMDQEQISNEKDFSMKLNTEKILREEIKEDDKILKWFYNIIILLGGVGFLCVGISSYINYDIIFFLRSDKILFYPQGITMCFYGTCALIISINQIKILFNNIGEGYNEFNKDKERMQIYRKGFKGKNSDVNIIYPLTDIVRVVKYATNYY
jgi:hypothetical protein